MAMLKNSWLKLRKLFGHTRHIKYWLAIGIFLIIMCFVDENNFFRRIANQREIQNLEEQVDEYEKQVQSNREKINELQTGDANLEKFAREEHLMKRPNEDVFIIKEKE
jgi:cell division protein DivIC